MSKTEQVLSIFLASPGDVSNERDRVNLFVTEWNDLWGEELGVSLRVIRWETHAYPAAGLDGQDVINNQLGEEYDLFLGIMWKRFGTPTGRAASGTVEEFERALERYRKTAAPQLMFYFKRPSAEDGDDAAQVQAVRQFRRKLQQEGLLYWEFSSSEQFSHLVRMHLTRHVQRWVKKNRLKSNASGGGHDELVGRFDNYLHISRKQATALKFVVTEFARLHLEYLKSRRQWVLQVRAMSDDQLTPEFQMRSIIEMAASMVQYADAAENFEAGFNEEFSSFVESVLGAAAVSTVRLDVKTKPLVLLIVELRGKFRLAHDAMGRFVDQLAKVTPKLSGEMVTSNQRATIALGQFNENLKFGDRMLFEAEKLFDKNRK